MKCPKQVIETYMLYYLLIAAFLLEVVDDNVPTVQQLTKLWQIPQLQ
jgi:hypothetical protein